MEHIMEDSRFSHIARDPRFRKIPKREKKIKIDHRFQSMFKDKNFKVNYTVDKRGRPLIQTSSDNLKRYYEISSEEESESESESESDDNKDKNKESVATDSEDKRQVLKHESKLNKPVKDDVNKLTPKVDYDSTESDLNSDDKNHDVLTDKVKVKLRNITVDYARGEGVLFSDSSSDEESSISESEEELDHGWGELDRDAERTDEITNRLAVCHMDWDRIKASDLMVLFNSFLPQGGLLQSVAIYPSEFGLKRMKEEDVRGPLELVDSKNKEIEEEEDNVEENKEGERYHMEKLRQYQLNRLKYFYAVLVFDSPETANKVYTDCDGLEYECSATRLDLRFVPDDTTFDEEPHEICEKLPDITKYQPKYFITTALQQGKVNLTWDETNPERSEVNKKLSSGQIDGISEADLRDYLATSSEEESEDEVKKEEENDEEDEGTTDSVSKYRSLLQEIEEQEEKKKFRDVEMEISWGVGLKDKTEKLVKQKLKEKQGLTPFEEYLEKRKEKKKQKQEKKKNQGQQADQDIENEYSDDDIPSDIDMNDPYFKEEFEGESYKKEKKNKKKGKDSSTSAAKEETEVSDEKKAELELLLMDDNAEKKHFSLKSILEQESESKKKKKKYKKSITTKKAVTDDFEIDVKDERFSALFTSPHFNLDPTDPHFRKTKAMEALRIEKLKRRQNETATGYKEVPSKTCKTENVNKSDPELSLLVKSIKRKTQNLQKRGR